MITDNDIYGMSNSDIISKLGMRFKEYRILLHMTQQDVAEKAGVSIFLISQLESGKSNNITMGSFLSLLRSIGFLAEIQKILPDIPPSPEEIERMNKRKKERVRHGK
nr:helix-turn-helix domain-containing protein [Prevotella sp.]